MQYQPWMAEHKPSGERAFLEMPADLFGVRRPERSDDGALAATIQSGVAVRLPPQSKTAAGTSP